MPRYGGFRGDGKRHIVYRLITDASEGATPVENMITCESFIDNGLQDRMLTSQAMQLEGKKGGEYVEVVFPSPKTVRQGMWMGFNQRG